MRRLKAILLFASLTACAGQHPQPHYPAFTQAADIQDSFIAGLPGTRAKIFLRDAYSRRSSMLLQLPPDWSFSTGAAPDKTLEIYLLQGDLTLGEFGLEPGGYAYFPAGSVGVSMSSASGALLLYFLDDVQADAVIQTPIIGNSGLLEWGEARDSVKGFGIATKELRADPGSGARTWLMKIEPGVMQEWQQISSVQEGYLVSGHYRHSECVSGQPVSGEYTAGGYFLRPPNSINGGPDAVALQTSIWLMRVQRHTETSLGLSCNTAQ